MKIKLLFFMLIASWSSTMIDAASTGEAQSAWVGAALTVGGFIKGAASKTCEVVKPAAWNATAAVGNYLQEWKNPTLQGSQELVYTPFPAKKPLAIKAVEYQSSSDGDSDSSYGSDKEDNFAFIARKKSIPLPFANPKEFNDGLQSDATGTMHVLNQAVEKYFKQQNPAELVTQKAIYQTCNCLARSKPVVKLPEILADTYNERQRLLLDDAIARQVKVVKDHILTEHDLAIVCATDKRDKALAKVHARFNQEQLAADSKRDQKLSKSMKKVGIFAANAAYINSCATKQKSHAAHDEKHFKDLQAYQAFLAQVPSK